MKAKSKQLTVPRVYHPWWMWECYKHGFYNGTTPENIEPDKAETLYRDFLRDSNQFTDAMFRVASEWPNSCEHFLTNTSLNRIAWLGQSAMCIATGVPSKYRSGFKLLSEDEQLIADTLAEEFLILWLEDYSCRRRETELMTT